MRRCLIALLASALLTGCGCMGSEVRTDWGTWRYGDSQWHHNDRTAPRAPAPEPTVAPEPLEPPPEPEEEE